jgi:hypothetical protein
VERASFAGCVLNLLQAFSGDQQLVVPAGMGLGMIAGMNFLGHLLVKFAGRPLADAKTGEDSFLRKQAGHVWSPSLSWRLLQTVGWVHSRTLHRHSVYDADPDRVNFGLGPTVK